MCRDATKADAMLFLTRSLLVIILTACASVPSLGFRQKVREVATVRAVAPFQAATSGRKGFMAILVTDRKVTYVVEAKSLAELHSLKQGETVCVWRHDIHLFIKRQTRAKTFSLRLMRIDPCPPEMLHSDGSCVYP